MVHKDTDDLDGWLANIQRSSLGGMFQSVFESKPKPQAPPLKLHDTSGNDFVRLLQNSRTRRYQKQWHQDETATAAPISQSTPSAAAKTPMAPSTQASREKWQCTQECTFRADGSEETIYERYVDGMPTETLHHIAYPDGTVKRIQKQNKMVASSSVSSSLSSLSTDTEHSQPNGIFKRAWRIVFDERD